MAKRYAISRAHANRGFRGGANHVKKINMAPVMRGGIRL